MFSELDAVTRKYTAIEHKFEEIELQIGKVRDIFAKQFSQLNISNEKQQNFLNEILIQVKQFWKAL